MNTKVQVYKAAVHSTLMFGSQSWTLYCTDIEELGKFYLAAYAVFCNSIG